MKFCDHFEGSTDFLSPAVLKLWIFDQFWPHFGSILRFRPFLAFLGHFRLSEKYIYLKTPIINEVLWSFWGVNRLSIASGSQVMNFFTNFDPILAQFWDSGPFWHFGALPVVWEIHVSENNYIKSVLWSFWGVNPTLYYHILQDNEFDPILGIWALLCILSHF